MIDTLPVVEPVVAPSPTPSETLQKLMATPDDFARWLLDHESNAVVGSNNSPLHCPLATYASERMGRLTAIGSVTMRVVGGERMVLPSWAEAFVHYVDSPVASGDVSRDTALSCLNKAVQVPKEYARATRS